MRRCIRRGSYPFLAAGSTRHCTGIHHDFGATMETTIAELYRQCTFPLRPNKTNFHAVIPTLQIHPLSHPALPLHP